MVRVVKLISIMFLALFVQTVPFTLKSINAQRPEKQININRRQWNIRPGGTVMVDIHVPKQFLTEKFEVSINTSPLQIRAAEDSANEESMNYHLSLFVTAPASIGLKTYPLTISISNGDKVQKQSLSFSITNIEQDGPLIFSASYTSQPQALYLGGIGFGTSPQVFVNGRDVTEYVTSAGDTSIVLQSDKGNKLRLKRGANEIVVVTDGQVSNTFILNL